VQTGQISIPDSATCKKCERVLPNRLGGFGILG
jgi:hypothetical protein